MSHQSAANGNLLNKMRVIGIGETVLDILFKNEVPVSANPGGSTFNAMISVGRTAAKMYPDVSVKMISETGSDHIGDIIVSFLEENNVSADNVVRNKGTQSHLSIAFLDNNNDADYEFYKDHDHAFIPEEVLSKVKFDDGDIVVFGSYFSINPKIRPFTLSLLKAARSAGAILYYDVNFRKNHLKDLSETLKNVEENFRLADFVRGSVEDFSILFGTSNPSEIYHKHISPYCANFICTCGADPVHVFTPSSYMTFEVEPIEPLSTVGAGDNFNAGFVFGLIKEGVRNTDCRSLEPAVWSRIVRVAGLFSSESCSRIENYVGEDFWKTL